MHLLFQEYRENPFSHFSHSVEFTLQREQLASPQEAWHVPFDKEEYWSHCKQVLFWVQREQRDELQLFLVHFPSLWAYPEAQTWQFVLLLQFKQLRGQLMTQEKPSEAGTSMFEQLTHRYWFEESTLKAAQFGIEYFKGSHLRVQIFKEKPVEQESQFVEPILHV